MAKRGLESHFPFITIMYVNEMIHIPEVQLGEEAGALERCDHSVVVEDTCF